MSLPTFKVNSWEWRLAIFASVILVIYCIRLWQPDRQIELHQRNFLLALEDRKWGRVRNALSENFSDRFGHTRDSAVEDLTSVLRQFFAVTIRSQGTSMERNDDSATVTTNLSITGTGPGLTDFIMNEVNGLPAPWKFEWKKESVLPWDWKLQTIDNTSLPARWKDR